MSGEKFYHYERFPVMAMGLSADMQLLAFACNMDGTLRIARIDSKIESRFFGANLLTINEVIKSDHNNSSSNSEEIIQNSNVTANKNSLFDIDFSGVGSIRFMVQISCEQMDVLSYMNKLIQPHLLHPNINKMKRIVHAVDLVNSWASAKRVKMSDSQSYVRDDPRWHIFSLKVAQWVYLCEYFPFRMSLIVHTYTEQCFRHRRKQELDRLCQNFRICHFYKQQVEPKVHALQLTQFLTQLDGPADVFSYLIGATPSTPLADKMFASTFFSKYRSFSSRNVHQEESSMAEVTNDAFDLTDIVCKDLISSRQSSEASDIVGDGFDFTLLKCTFNLDPKIRQLIRLQVAK